MSWDRVAGHWKSLNGKIKEEWGKLTDNDIDVIDGYRERLEGKLQDLYGWEKDQVRKAVDKWAEKATF